MIVFEYISEVQSISPFCNTVEMSPETPHFSDYALMDFLFINFQCFSTP